MLLLSQRHQAFDDLKSPMHVSEYQSMLFNSLASYYCARPKVTELSDYWQWSLYCEWLSTLGNLQHMIFIWSPVSYEIRMWRVCLGKLFCLQQIFESTFYEHMLIYNLDLFFLLIIILINLFHHSICYCMIVLVSNWSIFHVCY